MVFFQERVQELLGPKIGEPDFKGSLVFLKVLFKLATDTP